MATAAREMRSAPDSWNAQPEELNNQENVLGLDGKQRGDSPL